MTDYLTQNGHNSGCLVLAPDVLGQSIPEIATLAAYLQQIQFIGSILPTARESNSFWVGDSFLQLITFMGCSPHIELTAPPPGGTFCYIHIDGPWTTPQLRYGRNTQAPRCVACRHRITHWRELLTHWLPQPQSVMVECPRCSHKQSPLNLGWRKEAGFSHLFVVVENIFPSEAAPTPGLITGLERITGVSWQYFYVWM